MAADATLIYMVGRVNQGIRREMTTRLARWSLSVAEYTTLSVLGSRPRLSNAQLARRALVTPQSMIEILARLEDRGLVARSADPDHGRILRAALTAHGREVLDAANPAIDALHEELFAGVPARQRQAAAAAMHAAMANLSRKNQVS
ncbi:MAG TPA: MarR family transcriptional regulator [Solirubrobacteraceae bacterium]|jgi:DNA-binding MarR family transcriptional regulator